MHEGSRGSLDTGSLGGVLLAFWIWWTAYRIWSTTPTWISPVWQVGSDVLVAVGFALLLLTVLERRGILRWYLPAAAIGALAFYAVFLHATLAVQPGTDELALMRYAGHLMVTGRNPYVTSLAEAFKRYFVPASESTPTTSGTLVDSLSYPALGSWLFGLSSLVDIKDPVWVLIFFYLLAMATAYAIAPEAFRPWVLLVFVLDRTLLTLTLNGVTDVLYVPFLIGVVALWRKAPIWSLACMGLACAIKQTPWIYVPFLAMALWHEGAEAGADKGPRLRRFGMGAAAFAASFLLVNLPYAVITPRAWLVGTLSPLISHLVVAGQGMASVAFTHPVTSLPYILLESGAVLAALVVVAWAYPRYPATLWVLPLGAYFITARSLANYWGFLALPVALAVLLWKPRTTIAEVRQPIRMYLKKFGMLSVGAGVTAAVLLVSGALALAMERAQVVVRILSLSDPTHTDLLSTATLRVRDLSPVPVTPSFLMTSGAQDQTVWSVISGTRELEPGEAATVRIAAPDLGSAVPDSPGAAVVVSALVPPSGQYPSEPYVLPVTNRIANGSFKYWLPNLALKPGEEIPVGWTGQVSPTGDAGVYREPYGVKLVPRTNVGGGWRATSLVQNVSWKMLATHDIQALVSAPPAKASLIWTTFAGLEGFASNGVELWVTPARSHFVEHLGSTTVVGETARSDGEYRLTMGLRQLKAAHLAPNEVGEIQFAVAVAAKIHHSAWLQVRQVKLVPATHT